MNIKAKKTACTRIILDDATMLEEVLSVLKWDIFPKINATKCFQEVAVIVPEDGTGSISVGVHMRLTPHDDDSYTAYAGTHKQGIDEYINTKIGEMEGVSICPTVFYTEYITTA